MATSASTAACPECGASITAGRTEAVCDECDTVVDDAPVDYGKEWRTFSDGPDRERTKPGNRNHPDRGLGSEVGFRTERSKREERLNRWHRQAKAGKKKDRNRAYATSEIQRVGTALGLPDSLLEQAKRLFRQLHERGELQGRDLDTVAASTVYTVTRMHQRGLTPGDVAAVARHADADTIARRHTWVCREVGLEVPPPEPTQRVRVAGAELGADQQTVDRAVWLCERAGGAVQSRGKPSTLAAACLYRASDATQRACADAAGVSAAALRNRLSDVPEMGVL